MHIGNFDKGKQIDYSVKAEGDGVYAFLLNGEMKINEVHLTERDGLGILGMKNISFEAYSNSEILLIEVPVNY